MNTIENGFTTCLVSLDSRGSTLFASPQGCVDQSTGQMARWLLCQTTDQSVGW